MKQINPLYLIAALGVIIIGLVINTAQVKSNISTLQYNITQIETIAQGIMKHKEVWQNRKSSEDKMRQIEASSVLRGVVMSRQTKRSLYKLTLLDLNANQLDFFVRKVLQANLKVKALNVERKSDEKAEVHLEIQL
jgi:hypothetical protein